MRQSRATQRQCKARFCYGAPIRVRTDRQSAVRDDVLSPLPRTTPTAAAAASPNVRSSLHFEQITRVTKSGKTRQIIALTIQNCVRITALANAEPSRTCASLTAGAGFALHQSCFTCAQTQGPSECWPAALPSCSRSFLAPGHSAAAAGGILHAWGQWRGGARWLSTAVKARPPVQTPLGCSCCWNPARKPAHLLHERHGCTATVCPVVATQLAAAAPATLPGPLVHAPSMPAGPRRSGLAK